MKGTAMRRMAAGMCGLLAVMMAGAGARGDAADPAARARVDDFLRKLGSGQFANADAVEAAAKVLPAGSYEPLRAALTDAAVDASVRQKLEAAFPAVLRGLNTRRQKIIEERRWDAELVRSGYAQSGAKSPSWDNLVAAALEVMAKTPDPPSSKEYLAERAAAWKKAVDAGCRDPVVMHKYLAAQSHVKLDDKILPQMVDVANRFEGSGYPAYCKFQATMYAGDLVAAQTTDANDKKANLMRMFDLAMGLWAEVVETPGIADDTLYDSAMNLVMRGVAVGFYQDRMFELVIAPLRKKMPNRAVTDLIDGEMLLAQAAESRGGGWASEVTPQRMQAAENAATAAEKALEKAWQENPRISPIGVRMINAEMLAPHGRQTMEKWYQRAMAADPDNFQGPGQKLTYLLPRWYGSYDDMIAFGRECLEKGSWDSAIPTALLVVHRQIAQEQGMGGNYYANPAVWKDIQDVMSAAIKHDPAKAWNHQQYAYLAAISGHFDVARTEFAACGEEVDLSIFGSAQNCLELRKASGYAPREVAGKTPAVGTAAEKADAEYETRMRDTEKTQMMAWVRDKVLPARTKNLQPFFLKLADEHTSKGEDFEALFPAELLKSGKAAYVCGAGAKLFSFDLSPEQAKLAPGYSATGVPTTVFKPTAGVNVGSAVKLGDLVLAAKGPFGGGKNMLKGEVSAEVLKDLGPGNYQLRLWYAIGNNRNVMLSELKDFGPKGMKDIPFEFNLIEKTQQPLVVFMDVVRMRPHTGLMDISGDSQSNTSAALIDIAPGGKPLNP